MAENAQVKNGRRYVDTKETVGFVLFDVAANVKIDTNDEFIDRILNIDKGIQALAGPFVTAWDVINDVFMASIVDKTRTRFGKFRPYMVLYPLYGIPMAMMVYLVPYLFWGTASDFIPKIITWYLLSMFNDLTGTIASITRTGMIANITPNVEERLLLITKANFFSMFGEDLPRQIFDIVRDIITNSSKTTVLQQTFQLRKTYLIFGVGAIIISGGLSLYFALISKERVFGSDTTKEKGPTTKQSIAALKNNRPLLMLMLAEVLGKFNIKNQSGTYRRAVLNFANFGVIAGIPGSPVSYLSYSYIGWLRQRFSTKSLWIFSSSINFPLYILLYFFGMIKIKNPAKIKKGTTYMFMDLVPMLIAFSLQITLDMTMYGTGKVIPEEIRNECIDYGEWKNGFRSEGMTGVMRGLPAKISDSISAAITNALLKYIGFRTGPENYTNQKESTAIGLYAMTTIIPAIFGFISLVPKLFYNINQKDRQVMYVELAERRAAAAAALEDQHSQMHTGGQAG